MEVLDRAIPLEIEGLAGRILDCDGHEQTPINHWAACFGSVVGDYAEAISKTSFQAAEPREADDVEIRPDTVWGVKYVSAPGAFDMRRRIEVLDFTGVRRQLMFPGGMGLGAVVLLTFADDPNFLSGIGGDRAGYARKLIDAYNDWCIRIMAASDRTRAVAVLIGDTPEALLAEAKRLADRGVRAMWMPAARLPGGRSPAHADLDPVYRLLADERITLCAHVGADFGFYRLPGWNEAPVFKGFKAGGEFSLDPWTLCSMARAAENFVMTMVVGGVFERHPDLRMCVAELGAEWIGPLSRRMDLWIENSGIFNKKNDGWAMRLRPSEYVDRNIRVVPFYFEDVGSYVEQFGLPNVYCYGSDYPHVEGGKNPMDKFAKQLEATDIDGFGNAKFFAENGKWILPE